MTSRSVVDTRLTADYPAKRIYFLRLAKCSMTCRDCGFWVCRKRCRNPLRYAADSLLGGR
jgi:hypothetical protein